MKQISTSFMVLLFILATCCIHLSNGKSNELPVPMVKTINPGTNYLRNFVEARHAFFEQALGICHMPNGDFFISDATSCTIRKVSKADGKSYPYAGVDYKCDDQNLFTPEWIQCDPSNGELYVLDTTARQIKKITKNSVTNIAGGPFAHIERIHFNPLTREIFMTITGENMVIKVNVDTGKRQDVVQVEKPRGITQSLSGTLYISTEHHVIYKYENNQLTLVAGTLGQQGYQDGAPAQSLFNYPSGLIYDNERNELIISDFGNARIRKFKTNSITTIAGNGYKGLTSDGLATGVSINHIRGMSLYGGELYFIDGLVIRKLVDNYLETIMPNKAVDVFESDYKRAAFSGREIAVNSKNEILVLNQDSGVFKFSNGFVSNVVDFADAKNIAINNKNELFVGTETEIYRISSSGQKEHFAFDGKFPKSSGTDEVNHVDALLSVIDPGAMAISDDLSNIYFVEETSQRIRKFDLKTNVIETLIGESVHLPIEQPYALINGPGDSLYFSQLGSSIISKYSNGKIETIAGVYHKKGYSSNGKATESLIGDVYGLYLKDNMLYFSDTSNNMIRMINLQSGIITDIAGDISGRNGYQNGDAATALFSSPSGLVVMQNGDIIVIDHGNQVLRKISNGVVSLFAGKPRVPGNQDGPVATATFSGDERIELLPNGDILLADVVSSTIRKISNGMVLTFAGISGNSGFSGDGKQALQATLNAPSSVKVDKNGEIYCSDRGNMRIRKISQNGIIQTIAGGRGDFIDAKKAIASVSEIAFNENDEMVIADLNSIRKIDKKGIISTIVGNGESSFGKFCPDGTRSNACPLNPTTAIQYCSQKLYFIELNKLRYVKRDTIYTINSNVDVKHIACQKQTGKLLVATVTGIYLLDSNNALILLSKEGNAQNSNDGPFKSSAFEDPVFATSPSGQLVISEPPTTLSGRKLNNLRIVDCGKGFTMKDFSTCAKDACEGEFGICNGNGECRLNSNECRCDANYGGKQCEIMILSKVVATFTKSNIRPGSSPNLELIFNDQDFLKYYSGRYLNINANLLNERNEHVENISSRFQITNETEILINGKDLSTVGEFNIQVEIRDELTSIIVATKSKVKVLNQLTIGEIGGNGAAVAFAVIFALLSFGLGGALIAVIIIIKKRLFGYKPTAYETNDQL